MIVAGHRGISQTVRALSRQIGKGEAVISTVDELINKVENMKGDIVLDKGEIDVILRKKKPKDRMVVSKINVLEDSEPKIT